MMRIKINLSVVLVMLLFSGKMEFVQAEEGSNSNLYEEEYILEESKFELTPDSTPLEAPPEIPLGKEPKTFLQNSTDVINENFEEHPEVEVLLPIPEPPQENTHDISKTDPVDNLPSTSTETTPPNSIEIISENPEGESEVEPPPVSQNESLHDISNTNQEDENTLPSPENNTLDNEPNSMEAITDIIDTDSTEEIRESPPEDFHEISNTDEVDETPNIPVSEPLTEVTEKNEVPPTPIEESQTVTKTKPLEAAFDTSITFSVQEEETKAQPVDKVITGQQVLSLTFDDVSDPANTYAILANLRSMGVKATFFVTRYTDYNLMQAIAAEGHEIGNHTFAHLDSTKISREYLEWEIGTMKQAIEEATQQASLPYFRAPFGSYDATTLEVVKAAGYDYQIGWSIGTIDWSGSLTATDVSDTVVRTAAPGSIVLLHANWAAWSTPEAVLQIISQLSARGYSFATISELLALNERSWVLPDTIIPVESVLAPEGITLDLGTGQSTKKVELQVNPTNTTRENLAAYWSTPNGDVVSVDNVTGEIVGLRAGQATIYVTVETGHEISFTVTVMGEKPDTQTKAQPVDRVSTGQQVLSLTFDDVSDPANTYAILANLRSMGVKATFFVTRYTDYNLMQAIAAEGHEIGNHTFAHLDSTKISREYLEWEIGTMKQAIEEATQQASLPYFRAPFGSYDATTLEVAKAAGYDYQIGWSVSTIDWSGSLTATDVSDTVVRAATPGTIVLLHANWAAWSTPEAVLQIISQLSARGYSFATISELLALNERPWVLPDTIIPVESVLAPEGITLDLGTGQSTKKVELHFNPTNTTRENVAAYWSTPDMDVVSVNNVTGEFVGLRAGQATIYVTVETGHEISFTVTVLGENPEEVKKAQVITKVDASRKVVALTFDDVYYSSETEEILENLWLNNIRATFFVTGYTPDYLIERIVSQGHQLANHAYHHLYSSQLSPERLASEITLLDEKIENTVGLNGKPFFRAPYGDGTFNTSVLETLASVGYDYMVYWSHDTMDSYGNVSADEITEGIVNNVSPGAIMLLHANLTANTTADAIYDIGSRLRALEYEFVTVEELLTYGPIIETI